MDGAARNRKASTGARILAWIPIAWCALDAHAALPPDLDLTPVTSSTFSSPLAIRAPNDGSGRLFVLEKGDCSNKQGTARIWIIDNGVKSANPFLTLAVSCNSEQGLLGLAFHPQYASNGIFFVTFTMPVPGNNCAAAGCLGSSPDQVLARFQVSADPNVADPNSKVEILHVPDLADNHNGGDIHFGPDGYLYWSMGDGGVQGDPNGFALCEQKKAADVNPATCGVTTGSPLYYLLGKIMRLDVDDSTAAATSDMCGVTLGQPANYAIPAGNPRKGQAGYCGEIWAFGLRNPFRFSFDRSTGDMLIGDVGYNTTEEVDFQPAASSIVSGYNYGWRTCEGPYLQGSKTMACTTGILPIVSYFHNSGSPTGCSVIGGYRYRGPLITLRGTYLFSDLCTGGLFYADESDGNWVLNQTTLPSGRPVQPYGFGEDTLGNVYVADNNSGLIYQFTAPSALATIFSDSFEGP